MSSYKRGKAFVYEWIRNNTPVGATCLDVGACNGVWCKNLRDHLKMDAIEIFQPNIIKHKLADIYANVYNEDVRIFQYGDYHIIIFGDVLEHMTVEEAQQCLRYSENHSKIVIVAVPFWYEQAPFDGNEYERHIQPDLTRELVKERYPELNELLIFDEYGYYFWRAET